MKKIFALAIITIGLLFTSCQKQQGPTPASPSGGTSGTGNTPTGDHQVVYTFKKGYADQTSPRIGVFAIEYYSDANETMVYDTIIADTVNVSNSLTVAEQWEYTTYMDAGDVAYIKVTELQHTPIYDQWNNDQSAGLELKITVDGNIGNLYNNQSCVNYDYGNDYGTEQIYLTL